jgi:hypothetical protein
MLKVQTVTEGDEHSTALGTYTTAAIVSWAMAEAIGIVGLVLFLIRPVILILYLFIGVSAIAMYVYRPKIEAVEELASAMTQGSSDY